MLVCHCQVVNDKTIRNCVAEGARTEKQVRQACGAGAGCGGCRPVVAKLIEEGAEDATVTRLRVAS